MQKANRLLDDDCSVLSQIIDADSPAICKLWAIRLIKGKHLVKNIYESLAFEDIPAFLRKPGYKTQKLSVTKLQHYLDEQLRSLEQLSSLQLPELLARNIASLSKMMGLSATEQAILTFSILVKTDATLVNVASTMRPIKKVELTKLLALVLGLSELEVRQALKRESNLLRSGLLVLQGGPTLALEDMFDFVTFGFVNNLFEEHKDAASMFRDVLQQASAPTLQLSYYQHINTDLQILLPYLKNALNKALTGVNILLYGPPGTGKSELARVVAKKMKAALFEVSSEDDDGDAMSGEQRLRAYRIAQCFLANTGNILLFDETEDVFEQSPFARKVELRKGWMNKMLENNTVPCFWITNNHHVIDDAFIRRFDQVIELKAPPKAQRAALLQSASANLLTEQEAAKLAEHPQLTPAIISRAGKVVAQLNPRLKRSVKVEALQHLMQQTLTAQGYRVQNELKRDALGPVYDAGLVNTDVNLDMLVTGLKQAASGRLCLYGPAGTGKTAFCHYLAGQLQKNLLVKTASQLISKYVGETEQNIAAAFAEAKENDAVLLLDEVDSFLQDRRSAQYSWEVTAVNEMLVQMEAFAGIFVASTNLIHNLDQASLRRFDLKACFNYLTPQQALALYKAHCQQLKLAPCNYSEQLISTQQQLTPGDFAALARQSRFRPFSTARDFATALVQEVSLKQADVARPIGFLQ